MLSILHPLNMDNDGMRHCPYPDQVIKAFRPSNARQWHQALEVDIHTAILKARPKGLLSKP